MTRKHPMNLFVRECLTQALFRLMRTMNFSKITVSLLVRTAGVSRNSFYRNYASIEDVLRQYFAERTAAWWQHYLANLHPNVIAETFAHFLSMREEILLLYQAGKSHLLMEHIVACGQESVNGEIGNAYRTAFLSGGLCGLTDAWIRRGMKETPAEMQALFDAQGQSDAKKR